MHSLTITGKVMELPGRGIDSKLINRLIVFYNRQPKPETSPIWDGIIAQYHSALHEALQFRDTAGVYSLLTRLSNGMYSCGMEIGNEVAPLIYAERWSKLLLAFGNALGVLPVFNPEQPNPITISDEELLGKIESRIGHTITFSGDGGLFGYEVGGRFVNLNTLMGELVAWLCKPFGRCLEIGAGFGMVAIAALKHSKITEYHTIDLPTVSVIHSYFAATSGIATCLEGEAPKPGDRFYVHGTNIFPSSYDWVLNQDSLPEMPEPVALRYVRFIADYLKGEFHSINQESHSGGQQSAAFSVGTILKRKSRMPFWGRDGYVYEVYGNKP